MKLKFFTLVMLMLMLMCYTCITYGQSKNEEKIPLLIQVNKNDHIPPFTITTDCVNDTLRVNFVVGVRFEEKFAPGERIFKVKKVYPMWLDYTNNHGEEIHLSAYESINSPFDKCIWNICTAKFKEWLKEQPYSDMYNVERFYGYSGFSIAYFFYLIPE